MIALEVPNNELIERLLLRGKDSGGPMIKIKKQLQIG